MARVAMAVRHDGLVRDDRDHVEVPGAAAQLVAAALAQVQAPLRTGLRHDLAGKIEHQHRIGAEHRHALVRVNGAHDLRARYAGMLAGQRHAVIRIEPDGRAPGRQLRRHLRRQRRVRRDRAVHQRRRPCQPLHHPHGKHARQHHLLHCHLPLGGLPQ
jgi:hypothetical protein